MDGVDELLDSKKGAPILNTYRPHIGFPLAFIHDAGSFWRVSYYGLVISGWCIIHSSDSIGQLASLLLWFVVAEHYLGRSAPKACSVLLGGGHVKGLYHRAIVNPTCFRHPPRDPILHPFGRFFSRRKVFNAFLHSRGRSPWHRARATPGNIQASDPQGASPCFCLGRNSFCSKS